MSINSTIADHMQSAGHNIKWDHFEILEGGKTDNIEKFVNKTAIT